MDDWISPFPTCQHIYVSSFVENIFGVFRLVGILVHLLFSFSALLKYNDNIFVGGSFRGYNSDSRDAVALIFGFNLSEKITVAYSYDLSLSNLSTVNDGSHEITLNYNLGKTVNKQFFDLNLNKYSDLVND